MKEIKVTFTQTELINILNDNLTKRNYNGRARAEINYGNELSIDVYFCSSDWTDPEPTGEN